MSLTSILRGSNTLTLFWIYLCLLVAQASNDIAPFPASIRPVTAPGVSEVRPGQSALLASQAARARALTLYQHSPCRGLPDRTDAKWIEFISKGNATTDTQACDTCPEAAGETAPAARLWQAQSVDRLYACREAASQGGGGRQCCRRGDPITTVCKRTRQVAGIGGYSREGAAVKITFRGAFG